MIRLAFYELLLFLLPFIAFALWRLSMKATAEVADHKPAPVWILSAAGGILAAIGLIFLVFTADIGGGGLEEFQPPGLDDVGGTSLLDGDEGDDGTSRPR